MSDDEFRVQFQKLRQRDTQMAPPLPDFDAMVAANKHPVYLRYAPFGGAIAACLVIAFAMTLSKPDTIDSDMWQVAELPQWAASTDALLSISDRALPATSGFEPLDIKAAFGRSLTVGKGRRKL